MDYRDPLVSLVNKGYLVKYGPPLTITDLRGDTLDNPSQDELLKLDSGISVDAVRRSRSENAA